MAKNSARVVDYFVVCGLGPDLQSTDGKRGFQGTSGVMYQPALLDQFPSTSSSNIPPPPPQLPLCVLPGGVEFYPEGASISNEASHPRSYPIILTDGDGSKIYVSCVAFRDPVDDDVAQAYKIPANSYVDKCICVVSHSPSFDVFREGLEELHRLCFSPAGCSKPLWDVVSHMVSAVPLPSAGNGQVLFAVENFLLNVEAPPKCGLPHAVMSFQPLVQCLDTNNVIRLFTAILLERRVLLRANKYSVLTMVAEALCHLIYPIKWQHVYIPVLLNAGVDYIDAPTPYLMGLQSGVDTSGLSMDGVVNVDLDKNQVMCFDDPLPEIPEPELQRLRMDIQQLVHPNLVHVDRARTHYSATHDDYVRRFSKPWNKLHDLELRMIFLKFFATILYGYRDFVDHGSASVFNIQAFLKKRARMTSRETDPMVAEFLNSQGFMEFLEKGYGSPEAGPNLIDKIQEAMGRGQDPSTALSEPLREPEIFTVSDLITQITASRARHRYDRFPANVKTSAEEEKRRAILSAANATCEDSSRRLGQSNSSSYAIEVEVSAHKFANLNPAERAAERERMVLDIKVKLQGLWRRLLTLGTTDDPLSSSEYGTILALIESDAEGIGGSGFVECVREHIHMGWHCTLSDEQFVAVKELMRTTIGRATSRNDMATVRDALEISFQVHRKDLGGVPDNIQRHLEALPVWDDSRFWEGYFDIILERAEQHTGSNFQNYASVVTDQLVVLAKHMVGLGLPDPDSWFILETLAQKNNLGSKQLLKLRGILAHLEQLKERYWGPSDSGPQRAFSSPSLQTLGQDQRNSIPPPSEAAGIGRSWVHSMFSRDRAQLAGRTPKAGDKTALGSGEASRSAEHLNSDVSVSKRAISSMRTLRAHKAAITALHPGTRSEVGDIIGEFEESGYFISGSADCTVRLWDPSIRGSELRATFVGHTGAIRSISSDRLRVVTGSDDMTVLVWDKTGGQLLEELKGHEDRVSCVRMLSGERVLTGAYDKTVKMWDVRTDTCVATVGKHTSSVLCMDYEDSSGVFAAAGIDGVIGVWDVRAGKQMHKLLGHTGWVRSLRKVGETIVSGGDDWTARVWSVGRGTCDSVLYCHKGAVTCVDYCAADHGIITGSYDGMIRFWKREEGTLRSVKTLVGIHTAPVLSIKAGEKWLVTGAADNSMSLFHRTSGRVEIESWQLHRMPARNAATIRFVTSDIERGRVISGARNGLLRLWEPVSSL